MTRLLFILLSFFCISAARAQYIWQPAGAGFDDDVYALAEYNGELYAGGKFMNSGNQVVDHIAKWDGNTWQPVGTGLGGDVWSLVVYNGELYAGGFFNAYGYGIARWDGSQWQDVGGGMDDGIYALCVYNGKLFAGGRFTMAGSISAAHIACWDGTSWSALGSGTGGATPWVLALTVYQNRLIAGGEFTSAGAIPAHDVVAWNDTAWSAMGPSTTTEDWPKGVYTLCVFQNELFAGGYLDTLGMTPVSNLGVWNGAGWSAAPFVPGSYCYAMSSTNTSLVVGGYFTTEHIMGWNGSSPFYFATGTDDFVTAICFYNGHLFAGGHFTHTGGHDALHVAYWLSVMGVDENDKENGVQVFPVPTDGLFSFHFENAAEQRKLQVYSSDGKLVDEKVLDPRAVEIKIDETALPAGCYFYRLIIDQKSTATGKIIIAR